MLQEGWRRVPFDDVSPEKKDSLNSVRPNQLRERDHKTLWELQNNCFLPGSEASPSQQFQDTVRLLPWDPCCCLGLSMVSYLNKQQQICPQTRLLLMINTREGKLGRSELQFFSCLLYLNSEQKYWMGYCANYMFKNMFCMLSGGGTHL